MGESRRLFRSEIRYEIIILEFDSRASEKYGIIRAELEKKGNPIGSMDMLIAGHAKAEKLILVTNNMRKFTRVEGLETEDWTQDCLRECDSPYIGNVGNRTGEREV